MKVKTHTYSKKRALLVVNATRNLSYSLVNTDCLLTKRNFLQYSIIIPKIGTSSSSLRAHMNSLEFQSLSSNPLMSMSSVGLLSSALWVLVSSLAPRPNDELMIFSYNWGCPIAINYIAWSGSETRWALAQQEHIMEWFLETCISYPYVCNVCMQCMYVNPRGWIQCLVTNVSLSWEKKSSVF